MKQIIFSLLFIYSFPLFAQNQAPAKAKQKVIVKYKQYENFDLGSLEIKGSVIAPGDLSVQERSRRVFRRDLFERPNFNSEIQDDILNLR